MWKFRSLEGIDTISLKAIIKSFDTGQFALIRELEFGIFSKMRGVGIKECAGIPKCLRNEL